MTKFTWLVVIMFAFSCNDAIDAKDCLTHWDASGICVSILECEQILAIIVKSPSADVKIHECDAVEGSPKTVCCVKENDNLLTTTTPEPKQVNISSENWKNNEFSNNENCLTPWGVNGICVNIRKCRPIMKLLMKPMLRKSVISVLWKLHCGFEGKDPKVCCGELENKSPITSMELESKSFKVSSNVESKTPKRLLTEKTPTNIIDRNISLYNHPNAWLLNQNVCGPILEKRIVGGKVAERNEFPWMALLAYSFGVSNEKKVFLCAGSLINERYILTAAHCIVGLANDARLVSVRIGEHNTSAEYDCDEYHNGLGFNCAPPYQDFSIETVHVHPQFSSRHIRFYNDIGLIRMKGKVNLKPWNARPICLPLHGIPLPDARNVTVTGWGTTESALKSEVLLKVKLPLVPFRTCKNIYKEISVNIGRKQMCVGGAFKQDSCAGDSGGPLQTKEIYNGTLRTVQYGIVSFGPNKCGTEGYPGVYTSVVYYMDWILDNIAE